MPKPIFILNGPNLNLLGQREPEIYGYDTLDTIRERAAARAAGLGLTIELRQTNWEGALIESVHEAREAACGIVINPAGFTFTSVALMDALKMFAGPKIELHISNVHAREPVYHKSLVSPVVSGIIIGLGAFGYELAVEAMARLVAA